MRKTGLTAALAVAMVFGAQVAMAQTVMIEDGKTVKIDYTLTVEGEVIDSSEGKAPLEYMQGASQIIPGLEKQLAGLKAGDKKTVTVAAADAYGEVNPAMFQEIPLTAFPPEVTPEEGMLIPLQGQDGRPLPAIVSEVKADTVVLNFNHPLAGKDLTFDVQVVEVH